MDTLTKYRRIVEALVTEYASMFGAPGQVHYEPVFDRERDHYLLVSYGWNNKRRVHDCIFHLDIIDGKVWVQCNNTNRDIALEMVRAGIPREHIVLGMHQPELRQYTEFAVA